MLNLKKTFQKICNFLSSFSSWKEEAGPILELYEEDNNSAIDKTLSSAVSMASSTYYNILNVSLTPGIWLLTGFVGFAADGSSSTGRRIIAIGPNSAAANSGCTNAKKVPDTGHPVYSNVTYISKVEITTTYHLVAWHDKGSNLNCIQAELHATRLHKPITT